MKQKLHFFVFFTLSFKFFDRQNNLWSGRHKFTKEDQKNIIFQGCASSRGDEAQPSVWGRNQAHFCAINDFGCASSRRDEAQPRKNDVLCSLVNSSEIGAMRMIWIGVSMILTFMFHRGTPSGEMLGSKHIRRRHDDIIHSTTPHYITLHYTTLHWITLHHK